MPNARLPRGNATYINRLNKVKVLDLIRREGSISRAEIVRSTGLSAPTITRVVDSLITEEKLAREAGVEAATEAKVGRRPIMVEFRGEDNAVIGIDVGTTHIRGMLCDLNMQTLCKHQLETRVDQGFDKVLEHIVSIGRDLQTEARSRNKQVQGIGLAVAGLVNRETGTVEFSPDFDWEGANLYQGLTKALDCPLIIDNVTRVMALGELWHGIGRDHSNFVCVNVGYGIGSGIVLNDQPVYGNLGLAGEFGHFSLEKSSTVQCKCGNYGCLEALASGRAIALAAQKELVAGAPSLLTERCNGDTTTITAEMVVQAAKDGDNLAQRVFTNAAEYLGMGIAGLINLMSPEAVVIGGGVSEAGELLFDIVQETIQKRVMKRHAKTVEIGQVTFGMDAAVVGAASLILHEVMNLNLEAG
jgi:glucokinase-like ROK family protein